MDRTAGSASRGVREEPGAQGDPEEPAAAKQPIRERGELWCKCLGDLRALRRLMLPLRPGGRPRETTSARHPCLSGPSLLLPALSPGLLYLQLRTRGRGQEGLKERSGPVLVSEGPRERVCEGRPAPLPPHPPPPQFCSGAGLSQASSEQQEARSAGIVHRGPL